MAEPQTPTGWALRAHRACEGIAWVATVNALWLVFTVAGAVVLGFAPASAAAAVLIRRRAQGEKVRAVREFADTWRREFVRANIALAPAGLVAALLALQAVLAVVADDTTTAIVVGVLAVFTVVVEAVAVAMFAHYDLPLLRYLPTAVRWSLVNIPSVLLLAVAAVGIGGVSLALPGLLPLVTAGAWLVVSTTLCLSFFAANERALEVVQSR